jgi:predicted Zn-dependent protease
MRPSAVAVLLAALAMPACATNPVTGARELNFMSESQEIQLGQQSDHLGAGYVAKVGWQPAGMSGVLETLGRIGAASDSRGVPNWLSTHPQPADRVARVAETVHTLEATRPAAGWTVNRERYLQHLNGLIFGDNPREGVVGGREFIHPGLRFGLSFPEGWKIQNGKQQVAAAPPDASDVMIVLRPVPNPSGASLEELAVASMTKAGFTLVNGESTRLNRGLPAYHGIYDGQTQDGGAVRIGAAHIGHAGQVFLLAGLATRAAFRQAQPYFVETIRSFAGAPEAEMARYKPNRLAFATVRAGDSWQGLAERSGGVIPASDLAVVNGFAPNSQPPVGKRIKTVTSGD